MNSLGAVLFVILAAAAIWRLAKGGGG